MGPKGEPKLELAALLATHAFDDDDLAKNRAGELSTKQRTWCEQNPRFVQVDDPAAPALAITGRIAIEGRHAVGRMGETRFAELVTNDGDRFAIPPKLRPALVREAPYRAFVAHGWLWSIEPIAEQDLAGEDPEGGPYRTAARHVDDTVVVRALANALGEELGFAEADVKANRKGRFSDAQRSKARSLLAGAALRATVFGAALGGLVLAVTTTKVVPILIVLVAFVVLGAGLLTSAQLLRDAVLRVLAESPARAYATLENDPTNRDNFVFESEARPLKIPRGVLAIEEAPSSTFRKWRFEVYYVPRTKAVIAVRPLGPKKKKPPREAAGREADV